MISVRPIGAAGRQWAAAIFDGMNDTWHVLAADTLGTDWNAYNVVDHIGFGA